MQNVPKIDFTLDNQYGEPHFCFYDTRLLEEIKGGNKDAKRLFKILALCHTVMPERKENGKC